jgi:N-acetyl-anhydromuramyl-L-alanine amidase AmpD
MKRLLFLILIVTLPVIAFFEWMAYKRAHFPADFIYQTSDSLDLNYHQPELIADYFQSATELEHFGRYCWKEYKLDVLGDQPMESPQKDLVKAYQLKFAHVKHTEALLERSYALKQKGLKDKVVQLMLEHDMTESDLEAYLFLGEKEKLEFEDQGDGVFKAQQLLKQKGYDLPVDGYFEKKTLEAVKAFQRSAGIFPSGKIGDLTVKKLLE